MDSILFILSFVMLFLGGEFLVKSSVAIALKMRISTLVVGMTVVSFATSAPELFVSIKSALDGVTDITFGSVIGSNIANITLVLGLTAMVFQIKITKQTYLLNYPVMLFTSVLFGVVLFFTNQISQLTGFVFISLLLLFVFILIKRSRKENVQLSVEDKEEYKSSVKTPVYLSVIYMIAGVLLLAFGSEFLVNGVARIAESFDISERVISVSLVALGTSIPELATSLVAAFRKESNLAIGNLIGSNIFNVLAVLGITSIITPIQLSDSPIMIDYLWMMSSIILLGVFIYILSKKILTRIEGTCMFLFYIIFMIFLLKNYI
nr:sodium/calcium exchanger protein [uncultured bacterium]